MRHKPSQYRLGLVKANDFIQDILHFAQKYDLLSLFPEIKLLALADTQLDPDLTKILTSAGIRIFDHYEEMLAQIPEINTIIFFMDGPEFIHILRQDFPPSLSVIMKKKLQQSEQMAAIGELSTIIAHEIRNPLFAIGGFANALLRMPELSEKAQKKARIILDESKRLDKILKSILNFARPTRADISEVDVHEIIKQTMDLFEIACNKQNIHITLNLKSGLPRAKADPGLIKQGLINIIKNAMECMPDGGDLQIKTIMEDNMLCIKIKDTGPGIPAEHLSQIFNPFFSTKDKGSGLGLAMTKKIIDDLGGSLTIKSKVGQGTTVSLCLPPVLAVTDRINKNIHT